MTKEKILDKASGSKSYLKQIHSDSCNCCYTWLLCLYQIFDKDEVTTKHVEVTDPREKIKNVESQLFKKEGELEFLGKDGKQTVRKVDIEIAENDDERMQGLMYRKSMDDNKAMLFIFEKEEPQSFWMKNTIMSLDIIYVNGKRNCEDF
ncbi:MAG: DUF192 domain-containing protein [Ignavibacteria bacterium]|nr:DUF192 domain-containing protein [Ignavibacteria bacterium]